MNIAATKKRQVLIQTLLLLGIVFAANIIFGIFHYRIDLTADNRFTISAPTKKMLKGLNDVVYVKVYLAGKGLPAGMRKLSDATRDILDEFREVAGDKIQYQFISPEDLPDQATRENLYKQLAGQGLRPTELQVNEEDKMEQRLIIPGALVTYNNNSAPAILLQPQQGNTSPDDELNKDIAQLEYQLANAIRRLQSSKKKKIGIIQGHRELAPIFVADINRSLSDYYQVDFVDLPKSKPGRLDEYSAIIIAKPDSTFSEADKYKIDQYMVNGGRSFWFVETLIAEMDSLQGSRGFTANRNTNLEDLLFQYGVRINYNLVQDLNCHLIPLVAGNMGSGGRNRFLKWPYYPIVSPASDHPIVNSISPVWFQFASSMDTVSPKLNAGLKKTVLLESSRDTRVLQHPVEINLNLVNSINPRMYMGGPKIFSVLLEGNFNSAYTNRINPANMGGEFGEFHEKGNKAGKMIIVSDGDVIRNQVSIARQQFFPLGFDKYTEQTFGNKTFILNAVDYLTDDAGLISLRSKQFKLRLLDAEEAKASGNRFYWQMLNMIIPVGLILVFGLVFNIVRRRRFAG